MLSGHFSGDCWKERETDRHTNKDKKEKLDEESQRRERERGGERIIEREREKGKANGDGGVKKIRDYYDLCNASVKFLIPIDDFENSIKKKKDRRTKERQKQR